MRANISNNSNRLNESYLSSSAGGATTSFLGNLPWPNQVTRFDIGYLIILSFKKKASFF